METGAGVRDSDVVAGDAAAGRERPRLDGDEILAVVLVDRIPERFEASKDFGFARAELDDDQLGLEAAEVEALEDFQIVPLGIDREQVEVLDAGVVQQLGEPFGGDSLDGPLGAVTLVAFLVRAADGGDIAAPVGKMRIVGDMDVHVAVGGGNGGLDAADIGVAVRGRELGEVLGDGLNAEAGPSQRFVQTADVGIVDAVEGTDLDEASGAGRILSKEGLDDLVLSELGVVAAGVFGQLANQNSGLALRTAAQADQDGQVAEAWRSGRCTSRRASGRNRVRWPRRSDCRPLRNGLGVRGQDRSRARGRRRRAVRRAGAEGFSMRYRPCRRWTPRRAGYGRDRPRREECGG